MDRLGIYHEMRDQGFSAQEVFRAAKAETLSSIEALKILRLVFDLSLVEAKEAMIIAEGLAASLDQHQQGLMTALEQALNDENAVDID